MKKTARNRVIAIEVDIFHPKGRSMKEWEYIETKRIDVNTNNLNADTENVGLEVRRIVEKWLESH